MTCTELAKQVIIKAPLQRRGIKYFDEERFIRELICATDKGFISMCEESRIERIIRENDWYAWNDFDPREVSMLLKKELDNIPIKKGKQGE